MRNPILWALLFIGCALCSAAWAFVELAAASAMQDTSLQHFSCLLFNVYSLIALSMLLFTLMYPPKSLYGLYGGRSGY